MELLSLNISFVLLKYLFFIASICVLLNVQTIYSVFCLISAFVFAAGLMIMGGAVFVGFVLIVVYVGSVLIFFLFVTMMLDLRTESKFNFANFLIIIFVLVVLFIVEIVYLFIIEDTSVGFEFLHNLYSQPNVVVIGYILYTWYAVPLILCAFTLLVAMIGTIVLLLELSPSDRAGLHSFPYSQNIGVQIVTQDFEVMELRAPVIYYTRRKVPLSG